MRFLTLLLLLLSEPILALDADEIRRLADEPHSRENLVAELQIYPEARKYRISIRAGKPGEALVPLSETTATEHVVRGKYLVSKMAIPGADVPAVMVVEYRAESDTYKKWVLLPDGKVVSSTGVGDATTRSVAWISDETEGGAPDAILSIEVHANDQTTWQEKTLRNGDVIWISHGKAIVTE